MKEVVELCEGISYTISVCLYNIVFQRINSWRTNMYCIYYMYIALLHLGYIHSRVGRENYSIEGMMTYTYLLYIVYNIYIHTPKGDCSFLFI